MFGTAAVRCQATGCSSAGSCQITISLKMFAAILASQYLRNFDTKFHHVSKRRNFLPTSEDDGDGEDYDSRRVAGDEEAVRVV